MAANEELDCICSEITLLHCCVSFLLFFIVYCCTVRWEPGNKPSLLCFVRHTPNPDRSPGIIYWSVVPSVIFLRAGNSLGGKWNITTVDEASMPGVHPKVNRGSVWIIREMCINKCWKNMYVHIAAIYTIYSVLVCVCVCVCVCMRVCLCVGVLYIFTGCFLCICPWNNFSCLLMRPWSDSILGFFRFFFSLV